MKKKKLADKLKTNKAELDGYSEKAYRRELESDRIKQRSLVVRSADGVGGSSG